MWLVVLIWFVNFGISIWNAYAVGKGWVEAKHSGGWARIMAWSGAVMSASGFTWCYLLVLAALAYYFDWLTLDVIGVMIQLGYVVLIPGILLSGLAITFDSWANAYRRRTFGSFGTAAWNTYAQIHNTYSAIQGIGPALRNVTEFFTGGSRRSRNSDRDGGGLLVLLVVALVLLALLGGIMTTATIIHRVAGTSPLPDCAEQAREAMEARR